MRAVEGSVIGMEPIRNLKAMRDLRLIAIDAKMAPRIAQFRTLLRMVAERIQSLCGKRVAGVVFPWLTRFLLRYIELVTVSCVVDIAMNLPMAIYFHRITIFALPVNLFILPLLSVLMPAALLMLAMLFIWPAAATFCAAAVALVLHAGVWLFHLFGSLEHGDFRIASPLLWQSAAFYAFLAAAILFAHLGVKRSSGILRWSACACLLLCAIAAVMPRSIGHPPNGMIVMAIDVGQGDSLFIITGASCFELNGKMVKAQLDCSAIAAMKFDLQLSI